MKRTPLEPTPEECAAGKQVGHNLWATWYPQMGGYCGKAVVEVNGPDSCFEVWVWHDGDFPFHNGENPAHLHHCDAEQFRNFAIQVAAFAQTRPK